MTTTPKYCPGFDQVKHLSSFSCACPYCGEKKEIFSDEFEKKHICRKCKREIDFTQCTLEGHA